MLDDLRKIHERDAQDALGLAEKQWRQYGGAEFLRSEVQAWLPTVAAKHNLAKQIALECIGKTIVVYASPLLSQAAQHWKHGFNGHARQLAWVGELNPSELLGWTKQPELKPYAVVDLLSSLEPADVQETFAEAARMLSGLRPEPIHINATGQTAAEQLAWMLSLGDFVTIYTALLNGVNPTPGSSLDKFKTITEA